MAAARPWRPAVDYLLAESEPLEVDGLRLAIQSRTLRVVAGHWGLVWTRPVALLVQRDGSRQRTPILDVTRIAQIALVGAALVLPVFRRFR